MITKEILKKEYVENGLPARKIAEKYGCSHTYVFKKLKEYGLESRHKHRKDVVGKRFNKLTVLSPAKGKDRWLCRCDCGNVKEYYGGCFDGGTTRSCGCIKRTLVGKNSPYWKGYGDISGQFWSGFLKCANERNIDVNIGIQYAWNVFENQKKLCALSGVPITLSFRKEFFEEKEETTASIDRINGDIGYLAGNVQWVHKDINYMKTYLKDNRFIELCKLCFEYQGKKEDDNFVVKHINRRKNFTGYELISGVMWYKWKKDAELRKIKFEIQIKDAWELFLKQKGKCALSGLKLDFNEKPRMRTASPDRIDSSKGYVMGNVQWVYKDVNMMKNDFDQDYFLKMCGLVSQHRS
jgi:hypothetical protein